MELGVVTGVAEQINRTKRSAPSPSARRRLDDFLDDPACWTTLTRSTLDDWWQLTNDT